MVTGDGVADGDGPPGEFILWMMGSNQGVEFWTGVYVVRNNHKQKYGGQGISRSRDISKGGKMMLRALGSREVEAGRYLYLARARHGERERI